MVSYKILLPNFFQSCTGLPEWIDLLGHTPISVGYGQYIPSKGKFFKTETRHQTGFSRERYDRYLYETYGVIASQEQVDLILPSASITNLMPVFEKLMDHLDLPGVGGKTFGICRSKHVYLDILSKRGVAKIPERYGLVDPKSRTVDFTPSFPCVCKPSSGAGGIGVVVLNTPDEFNEFFGEGDVPTGRRLFYQDRFEDGGFRNYQFVSNGSPYLVEQHIEGDLVSISGIVVSGRFIPDTIYDIDITSPPACAEVGFHHPSIHNDTDIPVGVLGRVCEFLGINKGPVMADFIRTNNGDYYLIDFGPRMSSSAIKIHHLTGNHQYLQNIIESLMVPGKPPVLSELQEISIRSLMYPKGEVKSITIPDHPDVYPDGVPEIGTFVYEARNDHQILDRGIVYSIGPGSKSRTERILNDIVVEVG